MAAVRRALGGWLLALSLASLAAAQPAAIEPAAVGELRSAATVDARQAELAAIVARLRAELTEIAAGTPAAVAVDRRIADQVSAVRRSLDDALDTWHGRDHDAGPGDDAARELEWRAVEIEAAGLRALVALRLEAAARLPAARRAELLGFGRDGIDQLRRELHHLRLAVRLHIARRLRSAHELPSLARDFFSVGNALTHLLLVVGALITALFVHRRLPRWLQGLREHLLRSSLRLTWKQRGERLVSLLETIAPWALFLATLWVVDWALGPRAATTPEAIILLSLLAVYGSYRLLVDLLAAILLSIAAHYRIRVSPPHRRKLLGSIRVVLGVGALAVVVLLISGSPVGQGYLSALIVRFLWLAILATIAFELLRWRHDLVATFLRLQPRGRLSAAVRAASNRWYVALVAPAALVWLAGRATVTVAREFALGFQQTQKALAFVFRQRIERQAERSGYADGTVADLAPEVLAASTEEPAADGDLVVDQFPGLTDLHAALSAWHKSGVGGSFLATVGGYDGFAAFAELVNRTCRHLFWVCSMSAYAWRQLSGVRRDAAVFRRHVHLSGRTEERIRELIDLRRQAAGCRFSFADLVAVARLGRSETFIHLHRALELGAIEERGEMYRLTTAWHRAVVRLLRRRNLLPS